MKTTGDKKQIFLDQVNYTHIQVDWDSGHYYSFVNHPLMNDPEFMDDHELEHFINDWLSENEPSGVCVPDLINKLGGNVVECECSDHLSDDDIEQFIYLVETHSIDPKHSSKWYRLDLLKRYLRS